MKKSIQLRLKSALVGIGFNEHEADQQIARLTEAIGIVILDIALNENENYLEAETSLGAAETEVSVSDKLPYDLQQQARSMLYEYVDAVIANLASDEKSKFLSTLED